MTLKKKVLMLLNTANQDISFKKIKMNSGIFILGGITFLSAFVLFKISAFIYLLKDIEESKKRSWLKLFQVFVVDLISGVIGTGILFMTLLKIAHG
jgi:hypothetical protein